MTFTNQKDPLVSARLRWIFFLSLIVLLLIVGLVIASHVVGIYHFEESYLLSDGSLATDRYTVKKQGGVYALFDRAGNKMEQNDDGKYIAAKSGNQYTIDPESGDWSLYAVVEYDAAGGESLGNGRRILIFPQILQKDLYSIRVENEYGSYEIARDSSGSFRFVGIDNPNVSYDAQKFSAFTVGAGYPTTLRKLDLSSAGVERKDDGSVDYAAYGLEARADGYKPVTYTISARDTSKEGYAGDPDRTYTLLVGDKTLTGEGYYVRLAGREAIYIVPADAPEASVKLPVESLVSAYAVIPTTVSTYPMVQDFLLARMTLDGDLADASISPIVRFDYQDQTARTNTLYETRPYLCRTELMEGYEINDGNASTALGLLYELSAPTCVHLGLGEGEERVKLLASYGITGDVFYLSYHPYLSSGDGSYGYSESDFNLLLIGSKNKNGTYYVASFYYDMILEVEPYYLSFLEWEEREWYSSYPLYENLSYLKTLSIETAEDSYHFELDNSLSYAFYIDEEGNYKMPSLTGGRVSLLANGTYIYSPNEGGRYTLYAIDFANERAYYDKTGNPLIEPEVNSNYLQIYSPEAGGYLNYTVLKKITTDMNEERYKTLTELDNFRYLWKRFLYFTIESDVDPVAFEKMTGLSVEDYLAKRVKAGSADVTIRYLASDDAASYLMNAYGYYDENGKAVKLFTENNEKDIILRFYRYSGQKALMTLELVTEYDESGNAVEHPEKPVARFVVRTDYLMSLVENAGRVVRGELVEDIE